MKIGVLRISLHIDAARSLKAKRQVLRSLKDRLSSRFNVAVAEVDDQDLWQRAVLGLAIVSLDARAADATLRTLEGFVRSHPGATVTACERDVIDFEGQQDWWQPPGVD